MAKKTKIITDKAPQKKNVDQLSGLSWAKIYTSKWFIPLILVFGLAILLCLRKLVDIDLGFHLRGGQWILENMSFHKNDVFTYTVNNHEYIAMYWLFQILVYLVYLISSYEGLTIFKTLLITGVFWLVFLRMKMRGVQVWVSTLCVFVLIFILKLRFELRPEIFTWIFLLLQTLVLDQYFYENKKHLWILVFISILWVNFHGLFILGWVVIAAYFLSTLLHTRRLDIYLAKWSLISILASIVNPYFFKGIAFPFYLFTRLQSASIFKNTIAELQSPWTMRTPEFSPVPQLQLPLYLYYAISILAFILLITTFRKRKVHECLLLAAFFYLSCTAIRNIPLFVLMAIQVIAVSLNELLLGNKFRNLRCWQTRPARLLFRLVPTVSSVVILGFYPRIITGAFYVADRYDYSFGLGLDQHFHPVATAEFMVKNNLNGRILNDLESGSWFIWKLPQPVFIDGRLEVIKEDFYTQYQQSFVNDGLSRFINQYQPQLIVFDYFVSTTWNYQLKAMADWRMIYWHETSVIYAYQDYALELPTVNFMSQVHEMGIDTNLTNNQVWEILKTPEKSKFYNWFEGFFKTQDYPFELLKMGIFAFRNNELRAGEILHLEFLKKTKGTLYEVYFNLGSLYYTIGDFEKAIYCYQRVLNARPDNELAQRRLREMGRK